MAAAPDDDRSGLDALRRRVYGRGATAEDVRRYRDALGTPPPPPARSSAEPHARPPSPPPPERPLRRRAAIGVGVIALAAAALTVPRLLPSRTTAPPASAPTASGPVPLSVPATMRTRFVSDLRQGRILGISRYFEDHPSRLPPALRTLRRADTVQYSGAGPGAVDLNPSALADRGGRITVVLVVDRDASVRWSASRTAAAAGVPERWEVLAGATGAYTAGLPASATGAYRGSAPVRLDVDLAPGVRWGAAVVLSD